MGKWQRSRNLPRYKPLILFRYAIILLHRIRAKEQPSPVRMRLFSHWCKSSNVQFQISLEHWQIAKALGV